MDTIRPFTPFEANRGRALTWPSDVIETWNRALKEAPPARWPAIPGTRYIKEEKILRLLADALCMKVKNVPNEYLVIESLYHQYGWEVKYFAGEWSFTPLPH